MKLRGGLDPLPRHALESFGNLFVITGQAHEGHELIDADFVVGVEILDRHFVLVRRDDDFEVVDVAARLAYQGAQRRE